jgi:hypothetical protein
MNYVEKCVLLLNGQSATGRLLGKSAKAVRKWVIAGKLPRTEATGESNYAEQMAKADPRIDKDKLLATVMRRPSP